LEPGSTFTTTIPINEKITKLYPQIKELAGPVEPSLDNTNSDKANFMNRPTNINEKNTGFILDWSANISDRVPTLCIML
jgi:hypothetical protein